jgi:hypothetical protein
LKKFQIICVVARNSFFSGHNLLRVYKKKEGG